jgi:hypothetical protein
MIDHTPEEDEAFSAMEQSSIRKEIISNPSKEAKLLMEVALLTDLVRDLADRVRQLEAK